VGGAIDTSEELVTRWQMLAEPVLMRMGVGMLQVTVHRVVATPVRTFTVPAEARVASMSTGGKASTRSMPAAAERTAVHRNRRRDRRPVVAGCVLYVANSNHIPTYPTDGCPTSACGLVKIVSIDGETEVSHIVVAERHLYVTSPGRLTAFGPDP
jgi:hypothetical protein